MWKNIWNKSDRINKIILEMLIKLDGFDNGPGNFSVENWIKYTNEFYKRLNIKKGEKIYEIGCGSGAFLYPLYLKGYIVGGIDYSIKLIEMAKKIMPNGYFELKEAIKVDYKYKYDYVISHGVFIYFNDLDYAIKVLEKMLKKARKKIGIFDINDKEKEDIYHAIRMGYMDKYEYKKKYDKLKHIFYTKDFFYKFAKENRLKIHIWDQTFKEYGNSKLRFNVIIEK